VPAVPAGLYLCYKQVQLKYPKMIEHSPQRAHKKDYIAVLCRIHKGMPQLRLATDTVDRRGNACKQLTISRNIVMSFCMH
jgi:hypothetical protein